GVAGGEGQAMEGRHDHEGLARGIAETPFRPEFLEHDALLARPDGLVAIAIGEDERDGFSRGHPEQRHHEDQEREKTVVRGFPAHVRAYCNIPILGAFAAPQRPRAPLPAAIARGSVRRMWRRSIPAVLVALLVAGGASAPFPADLLRGVDRSLGLATLRAPPATYRGARVMVGGQVIATTPKPGATEIEILAKRLGGGGAPESGDRSDGRFLARTAEFLDPAIYAPGRRLTVLGTVKGTEERPIGTLAYTYVVVEAERLKLWPRDENWVGNPSYPPLPLDTPVLPYPR